MKLKRLAVLATVAGLVFSNVPVQAAVNPSDAVIDLQLKQNGAVVELANEPLTKRGEGQTALQKQSALPEKFDLRDEGYVTPVRNQIGFSTCWSFGAIGSLESNRLMKGLGEEDYSEKALVWYEHQLQQAQGAPEDLKEGYLLGNIDNATESGRYYQTGGTAYEAAAQMVTGLGLTTEAAAPYTNSDGDAIESGDWTLDDTHLYDGAYRLEDVTYQDMSPEMSEDERETVNQWVKEQIYTKGAVSMMYGAYPFIYPSADDQKGTPHLIYTPKDAPWGTTPNHFVTIVGWDDTYPKENFPELIEVNGKLVNVRPEHDGVWIMKNSWGTGTDEEPVGKDGYFLVSYDDASIANFSSYTAETENTYDNLYQYDYLGAKTYTSMMVEASVAEQAAQAGQVLKSANIFTADGPETLTAVSASTIIWDNADVQVDVYKVTDSNNPESGEKVASQTYTDLASGIHTLYLDTPVQLNAGEQFSVVETISAVEDGMTMYGLPVEMGTEDLTYVQDFNDPTKSNSRLYKATNQPGESFVYGIGADGEADSWHDLADTAFVDEYMTYPTTVVNEEGQEAQSESYPGNVMIKAYTVDSVAVPVPTVGLTAYDSQGAVLATITIDDLNQTIELPAGTESIRLSAAADNGSISLTADGKEISADMLIDKAVLEQDGAVTLTVSAVSERGETRSQTYTLRFKVKAGDNVPDSSAGQGGQTVDNPAGSAADTGIDQRKLPIIGVIFLVVVAGVIGLSYFKNKK